MGSKKCGENNEVDDGGRRTAFGWAEKWDCGAERRILRRCRMRSAARLEKLLTIQSFDVTKLRKVLPGTALAGGSTSDRCSSTIVIGQVDRPQRQHNMHTTKLLYQLHRKRAHTDICIAAICSLKRGRCRR
ncbi:putative glycosyltransferase [Trichinella spiralis]|uniref:Uncharacterized protein n=1 Tax=Trichinella spiralis TaxID=6334 RepID=E5SSM8_TRISP|nr:putative glycosyltransferase [Trichinella spiralis]KRY33117.1 hypothetical protein T01_7467 [Trichinella spiralis]